MYGGLDFFKTNDFYSVVYKGCREEIKALNPLASTLTDPNDFMYLLNRRDEIQQLLGWDDAISELRARRLEFLTHTNPLVRGLGQALGVKQ